jgi:two-component sensor histidine kinase
LKQDVRDVHLDINQAIPCGLIISELVSNSIKHAFSERDKGEIFVGMDQNEEGEFSLTIRDDGKGLASNWDNQDKTTLGLHLVKDLVIQLSGQLDINTDKGTAFQIKFPGI